MIDTHARSYFNNIFYFLAKVLNRFNIKPLQVTYLALVLGLIGALSLYNGFYISSLVFLWLSGLFDVLDGELARLSKNQSAKGALLDIFFDRVVEISYIFAFIKTASTISLLFLSCSIILSMTIFLTVGAVSKAQSNKAFYYQAGMVERTEGFIFFSLMIIFPNYSTYIAYLFAFLISVTVVQRLKEAIKNL